jgi:hypothetical protein
MKTDDELYEIALKIYWQIEYGKKTKAVNELRELIESTNFPTPESPACSSGTDSPLAPDGVETLKNEDHPRTD